jgi:CheY-like chemotaxis protein
LRELGPRARRAHALLHERILAGEFPDGARLPAHTQLAADFGIAVLTLRQALARLEHEGLVSREQGRGTFVRRRPGSRVLVVEDSSEELRLLCQRVEQAGYPTHGADGPLAALAFLEGNPDVCLILTDVRMPATDDGVEFIRRARRRWPHVPLAAITGFPDDLDPLTGTPECPFLVLRKPFWAAQLNQMLALIVPKPLNGRVPEGAV